MKKIILYIALITTWISTGQIYPVQVTPQLIPPYSLKLSDYETTSSEKLFVNLLLTDTQEAGRQVRLKMYIEGQGLNIQTLDFVAGAPPIYLDGGINQRLSNLDLRAYFNLNNLLGLSPQLYSQALPDGRYNFCFEVYDYFSGQRLSRKSCFPVYLILNDPPFLNLPSRGDLVTATNPQNIIFNWTPRHLNATGVQYQFTLKEIWDSGMDPQAAFVTSPPLHQETTFATTLLYGPVNTALLEGKTYGWQVRALVSDGISETSVFRNNGYSEIYHFKYEGNCEVPQFVISEAENSQTVQITWQFSEHLRYQLQYRKKGYGEDDWFEAYAYNQQYTIRNLEAGTTYEFRVGGECTPQGGFAFSPIQEFTTPTEDETAYYNCGVLPEIEISNQDPLQNIGVNELFTAGDFPVTVKEVNGENGIYSGWGFIVVPYLADTKIRVEFEGIHINTDFQLIQGVVQTTYDADWKNVESVDDVIDDIFGNSGKVTTFDASQIDIDTVEVDENGKVILIDKDGNPHPIEVDAPVVITDTNGDQWQVDEEGNVTPLGEVAEGGTPTADNTSGLANNGDVSEISSSDVSVRFTPSGFYSTDQLRGAISDNSFSKKYETIPQVNGGVYNVLYKAISNAPHQTDILTATATFSNGKTTDDIVFKTKQGTAVPVTWSGNTATLTLKKQFDFAKDEILATVKPSDSTGSYTIAGKVNIWHLAQQEVNITLVPVGNGSVSNTIIAELNSIYNTVGVHFNLTIDIPFEIDQDSWDVENANGKLDVGDSNALANYTIEERAIYTYYKTKRNIQNQMYYIFVLGTDIPTTDTATHGFMPLKRQYGFVFNPSDLKRTIAHELGHGIFGLEHPFVAYNIAEGATDLLMDYGSGTAFTHMDWQKIHAPGLQLYIFQSDEDGENTIISNIPEQFLNPDGTFTFLTMNGNYITLPEKVKKLSFVTGIDKLSSYIHYPTGSLQSFEIDSIKYVADISSISIPSGEYNINNFGFIYKGFKNYNVENRNVYSGSVITMIPDGDGRRLLKTKVADLIFSEDDYVNILQKDTYEKFQNATNYKNKEQEKNYSYGVNTPFDSSYILNENLVQHVFGEHIDWRGKYFIVSKLAFLNNSYPEFFKKAYSKLNISIYTSKKAYSVFIEESVKVTDLINYYIKIVNYAKNEANNCTETLTNLSLDVPFNTVKNCIDNLSNNELKNISVDDKIIALSILTNSNVVTNNSTEIEIIRLLKHTKTSDIDALLKALKGKSKTQTSKYLIKLLVYRIDNDHTFMTYDNYLEFIKVLTELSLKSSFFLNKAVTYEDDIFTERNINFYHESFWQNIASYVSGMNFPFTYCNFDTEVAWETGDTNWIQINNNFECSYISTPVTEPLSISPFSPVWFVNKSSLSMLSDYNKGKPVFAPAILAYYANDVGNTQNTIDGISATVDAVSLASGYGALIKGPALLRKAFIIADMLGSGVSLVSTATIDQNLSPSTRAYLDALNILTATIAVTDMVGNLKNIKTLFKKAKQNVKDLPSKTQVDNFISSVNNTTAQEIAAGGAEKIAEAKVWVKNALEEAVINPNAINIDNVVTARAKLLQAEAIFGNLLSTNFNNFVNSINVSGWSDTFKQALKADFAENTNILNIFNSATPTRKLELAESWKKIRNSIEASPFNGSTTQFAKDPKTLEKVANMMQEGSVFRNNISGNWAEDLKAILKTNDNLRCFTCGNAGYAHRSTMNEFLEEVEHFVSNFEIDAPTKGKKFYNWIKGIGDNGPISNFGNLPIADELHQHLKYLKNHPEINRNTIENIGGAIGNTTKRTDVTMINPPPVFKEFKSLKRGSDGLDDGNNVMSGLQANPIKNRGQFYSQFKEGYLTTIESLDELEYIFEIRKLGAGGEDFMKAQFKDLFIAKADDLFDTLGVDKFSKLFGVDNVQDFLDYVVPNTNNSLYNFIKVQ